MQEHNRNTMQDAAELLGSRIKALRKQLKLTQIQLADSAGLSPLGYQKIERGESFPKLSSLEAIARALGVKSTDLIADPAVAEGASVAQELFNKLEHILTKAPAPIGGIALSKDEERLFRLLRRCDEKTVRAISNMIESAVNQLDRADRKKQRQFVHVPQKQAKKSRA